MTYLELMELDSFAHAEFLVENTDINHYIRGVRSVETLDVLEWVKNGDLVFVSGVCLRSQEELTVLMERLDERKIAGMVVELGPYISEISSDQLAEAQKRKLPFIVLPYEIAASTAIEEVFYALFRSQEETKEEVGFMRELLYGDEKKALLQLSKFNYVSARQHIVIFLSFDKNGFDKSLLGELAKAVPINLSLQLFSVCYADDDGVIVALELSQKEPLKNVVRRIMSSVQKSMESSLQGNTVSAGVSSIFYGSERLKTCIEESKKAFRVLRGCNVSHSARYYEEIGIYRFFFEFGNDMELRNYIYELLGPLIHYDEESNNDLVSTLEVYLDENCHIGEAAEKIFVHRNTIKYRINRIEEILNIDLDNVNTQFNLLFAYKVRKYLGENS